MGRIHRHTQYPGGQALLPSQQRAWISCWVAFCIRSSHRCVAFIKRVKVDADLSPPLDAIRRLTQLRRLGFSGFSSLRQRKRLTLSAALRTWNTSIYTGPFEEDIVDVSPHVATTPDVISGLNPPRSFRIMSSDFRRDCPFNHFYDAGSSCPRQRARKATCYTQVSKDTAKELLRFLSHLS